MSTPNIPCPRCKKPLALHQVSGKILCKNCDYIPIDRTAYKIALISGVDMTSEMHPDKLRGVRIHRPGTVHSRALAAYNTGEDCLKKGENAKALEAFTRALDAQPDLIDAHLQVARLSDDPLTKVQHINSVLEYIPKQEDAFRMALVLMGALSEQEAARTLHYNDPALQHVEYTNTQTQANLCPICGGRMSVAERSAKIKCPFCGHEQTMPKAVVSSDGAGLSMALIKRKAQPVKWVIGSRILHCKQCGAQRTIPARKLTERCPFCNTPQVVVKDALNSFQQPEGVVPFAITREQAGAAIKEALQKTMERIKGFFDNRKIARATLEGVYLPFWVFDASVAVHGNRSDGRGRASFPDWVEDTLYCAVNTPARELTQKLDTYDLSALLPYEPRLLADYPAELYTIDYDQASIEARPLIAQVSKDRYDLIEFNTVRDQRGEEQMVEVYLRDKTVLFQEMTFQLVLLPVWIAALVEVDGDVRPALVNGQNAQVVLGRAQKPNANP
ncbi:MAG: hypothetical protein HXY40_10280 [Chloroflexi bacterium]|nr:hypothetical protein [Chloroflexota bacterium]